MPGGSTPTVIEKWRQANEAASMSAASGGVGGRASMMGLGLGMGMNTGARKDSQEQSSQRQRNRTQEQRAIEKSYRSQGLER
jgi:membrane protease subunit (stomatin/prohibitin family)